MKRRLNIKIALALALVLLCMSVPSARAEERKEPVNVSKSCEYKSSKKAKYLKDFVTNPDTKYAQEILKNEWVSISWKDEPVDFVYYAWTDDKGVTPPPYTIALLDESGGVLEEREGEPYWDNGVEIGSGVHGVRIRPAADAHLCTLMAFSGGAPSDYHPWQPTPEKLDFLVIAMHPDDDTLFMGNMIPTYGAERGLTGSILYLATRARVRRTEACNGAWIMGLRTYPVMAGLADISIKNKEKYEKNFRLPDVERTLVRYLRKLRPEVVITHDDNGEYGHWQHQIVAAAMRRAVVDAADPAYLSLIHI